jgi:hypothetical protein
MLRTASLEKCIALLLPAINKERLGYDRRRFYVGECNQGIALREADKHQVKPHLQSEENEKFVFVSIGDGGRERWDG